MWRLILLSLLVCAGFVTASCERRGDFITETLPFLTEYMPTPDEDHQATAERARAFADRHGMKLHYVPGHFETTEFSISVTRGDVDISVGNVLLGRRTLLTAYTRAEPSPRQRDLVDEFMCSVMLHGCNESDHQAT